MRIVSRPSGLDALRRRLASLPGTARGAVAPALETAAHDVAADVRAALDGEDHAGPSGPGTPPSDPAGRLAATVAVLIGSEQAGTASAQIAVSAPYAVSLEYGTARMAARPFLRPAALKAGQGLGTRLAAALRRGLTV